MRITVAYIVVALALVLGVGAIAAEVQSTSPGSGSASTHQVRQAPPTPPSSAPGASNSALLRRVRSIPIGPGDTLVTPRHVRGQVLLTAVLPSESKVVSVQIFCNNAMLGQKSQAPYQVDFNSETVADGTQILKAVGLDAGGKQVWTASAKIEIMNKKSVASPQAPAAGAANSQALGVHGILPNRPVAASPQPVPANPAKPAEAVHPTSVPAAAPIAAAAPGAATLGNRYVSVKYGFTMRYPSGWASDDKTGSIKPHKAGSFWVAFTPSGNAGKGLTINVRSTKLAPGTTADVFAKFNSYVSNWDHKTVLGSPAFSTTSTESVNNVIHRLIIIKGGKAWMLNCIDTIGTADVSKKLFDSVVASLTINASSSSKSKLVVVKEIKKH